VPNDRTLTAKAPALSAVARTGRPATARRNVVGGRSSRAAPGVVVPVTVVVPDTVAPDAGAVMVTGTFAGGACVT